MRLGLTHRQVKPIILEPWFPLAFYTETAVTSIVVMYGPLSNSNLNKTKLLMPDVKIFTESLKGFKTETEELIVTNSHTGSWLVGWLVG